MFDADLRYISKFVSRLRYLDIIHLFYTSQNPYFLHIMAFPYEMNSRETQTILKDIWTGTV